MKYDTNEKSPLEFWATFAELLTFLICTVYNYNKIRESKSKVQMKYWFLISLCVASVIRIISLLFIFETDSQRLKPIFYTAPILFWIAANIIFMAHLAQCYLQIVRKEFNLSDRIVWVLPLLLITYIYFIVHQDFMQWLYFTFAVLYCLLILTGSYFSQKLFIELEEDVWLEPFLIQMKKLVNRFCLCFAGRVFILVLISTGNIVLKDPIILMDIFIGEILPCVFFISTKITIPRALEKQREGIEMKSMNDQLVT